MAQYFDRILVSDKAMIKLVRYEGKDFIFKASKIQSFKIDTSTEYTTQEHRSNFGNVFVEFIADAIINLNRETKTTSTFVLVIDNEYCYVEHWSDDIEIRLNEAIKKSNAIDERKYGSFK